jgi:2-polyprenyl-3-methyl-5-hydroxy-6-metoxy-1,4-benzoquinol methylase
MNLANALRLADELPPDAMVIDVGGGAGAFPRADWVIDALPFDQAGAGSSGNIHKQMNIPPRYARERWIQADLCDRTPWPIADKQFDFAVCSHLLEDVRDPIWICSEISRIARAGYIEVPSRIEEQSRGVEHPRYCGYHHHRWLISLNGDTLEFRHKPHNLHSISNAVVTNLAVNERISQTHAICTLRWTDSLKATEVMEFNEGKLIAELCEFASSAKAQSGLASKVPMPFTDKLKRRVYRFRLLAGIA